MPGMLLLIVGVLQLLYYLGSSAWGMFGLLTGGLAVILQLVAAMDNSDALFASLFQAWSVIVTLVRTVVYVALLIPAGLAIRGGLATMNLTARGAARTGALAAIIGPILGLLSGLLAILNFNLCGFACGIVPDVVVVALGAAGGGWAWVTLGDPEVDASFPDA